MNYTVDIRKFIRSVIIFLSPLAALIGMAVFFSFYSGEMAPLQDIIKTQAQDRREYIFARGVIERETAKYKYLGIGPRHPDILAVGSSRILELRKEMFGNGVNFYNAGSVVGNLNDLVDFIDLLPKNDTPKIIILGLDIWWFDAKHSNERNLLDELAKPEEIYNWKAYLYSVRHIFSELVKNPKYLTKIIRQIDPFAGGQALGFDALEHGNGFRNDGSRQYAIYVREMRKSMAYVDREDSPFAERVKFGYGPFSLDSVFDEAGLDILDKFLAKSKERGIQIIGVTPPLAGELYKVIADSYYAPLLQKFQKQVPPVFARHGFMYLDFSDIASLGMADTYMFDGVHATETGAARMLLGIFGVVCPKDIIRGCQEMRQNLEKAVNNPKTTPAEMNLDTF